MFTIDTLDVVVIANRHRRALIVPHLSAVPHTISYTDDYELPANFTPSVVGMVQPACHTGVYRCFRGHQDAMRLATKDYVLLFEDDAVPENLNWTQFVEAALPLLNTFEMVSLHGRNYPRAQYQIYQQVDDKHSFLHIPNRQPGTVCVHGALAYLLRRDAIEKMCGCEYNGMPIDILLVSVLNFCMLEPSPFIHDRSEGSLLDVL